MPVVQIWDIRETAFNYSKFFDLDGTLLDSKRRMSDKTKITLKNCAEKGYKLFIVTARPPLLTRMVSWAEEETEKENILSLFVGGSYYNGGCIKIDEHKEYIFISAESVENIINSVQKHSKINIALQLEDEKHAFRFPLDDKGYKSWGITAEEAISLNQAKELKTVKILIFYSNLIDSVSPINESLVTELKTICENNAHFYLTDKGTCVQIMGKSVSKALSIEKIRKQYGFEKDEIAVFGDDINDMEMLAGYPFSVAMGNAEMQVKNIARYITFDNDNDGIYEAIHNILKLL